MKNYDENELNGVKISDNGQGNHNDFKNINEIEDYNLNNEEEIEYDADEYNIDEEEPVENQGGNDNKNEWKNYAFGKYKFIKQNVTWKEAEDWLKNHENLETDDLDKKFSYIITWLMPSDEEIENFGDKPVTLSEEEFQFLESVVNQSDEDESKRFLFQLTEYLVNFDSFQIKREDVRKVIFPQLCADQPKEFEHAYLCNQIDQELAEQYSSWQDVIGKKKKQKELAEFNRAQELEEQNKAKQKEELKNEIKVENININEPEKKKPEDDKEPENNKLEDVNAPKNDKPEDINVPENNNNKPVVLSRIIDVNGLKIKLDFTEDFTVDDLLEKNENGIPEIMRLLFPNAREFKLTNYKGDTMYGVIYNPAKAGNKKAADMTLGDLKINGEFDNVVSSEYLLKKAFEIKYGEEYVKSQIDKSIAYLSLIDAYRDATVKRAKSFAEFAEYITNHGVGSLADNNSGYGYECAAKIISRFGKVDKDKLNYNPWDRERIETDWEKKNKEDNWTEKLKEFREGVNELVNDFDFKLYVSELALDKKLSSMTEEQFVHGWTAYKQKMQDTYQMAENSLDTPITEDESDKKDSFLNDINRIITNINNKHDVYAGEQIGDACDNIILHTLKTKAAGVSFFSRVEKKDIHEAPNGKEAKEVIVLDREKTNTLLNDMRKTLLSDPVFQSVFLKHVPKKDFYKEYCAAINREINKDISDENEHKKSIDRNQDKKNELQSYMNENHYILEPDKVRVITEVYNDLKEFNKGKSPSKYMERLMNSLEDVVSDIDDGEMVMVKMSKLDKLNKAALKYYDKRQGIIFSPFTDDGQSRLASVARLVRTTNKVVKDIRSKMQGHKHGPVM